MICLTLLILIVGLRTYLYTWSWDHNTLITVVEVILNLVIVIDYLRNIIDAPVKHEFLFSMYHVLTTRSLATVYLILPQVSL